MKKSDITVELVERLIADQFPRWTDRLVRRVEHDGWDNTSFRLGEEFVVRLPSADGYIPQVAKEHDWLPVLASQLPLPIPAPVARAVPSTLFPRPWSVYRWLPGHSAALGAINDLEQFATDLGAFLRALQSIDATGGPAAGPQSHWRGGDLSSYDEDTRKAVADLAGLVDPDAVRAAWERAASTVWKREPVWVHGDVAASNLLVTDGRLTSVIDFGCSAIGDPACDLVIAWTLFAGDSRRAFRDRMMLDDATWERARGWALWKALLTYRDGVRNATQGEAERRFGWRTDAASLVVELTSPSETR